MPVGFPLNFPSERKSANSLNESNEDTHSSLEQKQRNLFYFSCEMSDIWIFINRHIQGISPPWFVPIQPEKRKKKEFKFFRLEDLEILLKEWGAELQKQLDTTETQKRTDSIHTLIARRIMKIPDVFLKAVSSHSYYTNCDVFKDAQAYLYSFIVGYAPVFGLEIPSDLESESRERLFIKHFLDYQSSYSQLESYAL